MLGCSHPEPSTVPSAARDVTALPAAAIASSAEVAPERWQRVPVESLSEQQLAQFQTAVSAREELFSGLMGRLQSVLSEGGPVEAIRVCRDEAPRLAASVSQKRGLRIGRTSFKLRNPENQPPDWAVDLLAQRPEEPVVLTHPSGRLATLLPIKLKAQCVQCHGPAEELTAAIKQALQEYYPRDAATGFREGDLRGWFWVEVPAQHH